MNMLSRVNRMSRGMASLSSQALQQSPASSQKNHTLPDLPYDYGALEPHISGEIMQLHHGKHHAAYVANLNVAEEKYAEALARGDVTAQVALQPALRFNGGGHVNHALFWTNLSPDGGGDGPPPGRLTDAIERDFGSVLVLKARMSDAAAAVQGSGWAWLGMERGDGRLHVRVCANQDPLLGTTGLVPLLGIDVWEHAYYLQYKNARPDYVQAFWNVVDWGSVSGRERALPEPTPGPACSGW